MTSLKLALVALFLVFSCSQFESAVARKTAIRARNLLDESDSSSNSTATGRSSEWLRSNTRYTGDGTAFSKAVRNGAHFACSFRTLPKQFTRYFAAINAKQWGEGAACGRCIKARCIDSKCPTRNKDVVVQVVDLCPECQYGDVDFSYPAYSAVTGSWPNRLKVSWEWTSCASEIDGTIKFHPKEGTNGHWQAFFLSNFRYPIADAWINGEKLYRSPYQFFIHGGLMPKGKIVLTIKSDTGAVLRARIKSMYKGQDLRVQFPAYSGKGRG